jgi:hypothetical protein
MCNYQHFKLSPWHQNAQEENDLFKMNNNLSCLEKNVDQMWTR